MKLIKYLIVVAAMIVGSVTLASSGGVPLDRAPVLSNDQTALQNGAKLFVNYCLNCHSASSMRYNRLKDIGLTEEQIKNNLLFSAEKVGETMTVAISPKDAKEWFGSAPPDLSVIARAKASGQGSGADYIYSYLRGYYRDSSRPTGWNNVVYPNVAMPHVLWDLQPARSLEKTEIVHIAHTAKADKVGEQPAFEKIVTTYDALGNATVVKQTMPVDFEGHESISTKFIDDEKNVAAQQAFNKNVADLTAFMQYMSDPNASRRHAMGVWVLLFLGVFILLAYLLNKEYWKDIK